MCSGAKGCDKIHGRWCLQTPVERVRANTPKWLYTYTLTASLPAAAFPFAWAILMRPGAAAFRRVQGQD
eukprot:3065370-Prymnesium_polylepis.1